MTYNTTGFPTGTTAPASDLGALGVDDGKSGKKEKKTTKRLVDRQILIAAGFALIVLIGGFFVVTSMNSGTYVVVAKQPINAGTVLTPDLVQAIKLPPDAIVDGAITSNSADGAVQTATQDFSGGNIITNQLIPQNGQLSTNTFGPGLALATQLPAGERLVSTSAKVANSVAGKLKPGDRVDVVATVDGTTGIIARNVPVVAYTASESQINQAANQQSGSDKNKSPDSLLPGEPIPGIYVLQVPTADAIKIVAARETGDINLLYLGPNATDAPAGSYQGNSIFH